MKTRLTENMFGEGVNATKEILVRGVKEPSEDIKTYLKSDDRAYYVLCKRVVEGKPAYLEESFFSQVIFHMLGDEDICQTSIYDLIEERAAVKISKVIQTIEVTELNGDASEILKVKGGSSALLLHRLLIGTNGKPLAYTRLIGSGRTYKIQTEFEKIR